MKPVYGSGSESKMYLIGSKQIPYAKMAVYRKTARHNGVHTFRDSREWLLCAQDESLLALLALQGGCFLPYAVDMSVPGCLAYIFLSLVTVPQFSF